MKLWGNPSCHQTASQLPPVIIGKSRFYLQRRFMALQNNHREMLNYRLDLESVRLCGSISSLSLQGRPVRALPVFPTVRSIHACAHTGNSGLRVKHGVSSALQRLHLKATLGRHGRVSGLRHNEVCRLTCVLSVGRFHPKHHRSPSTEWQDDGWCVWVVPL